MDGIRVERRGATMELTIDRPKANAIDSATSRAMGEAFAELRDDPELRVAIVTGAGERFFSAGWDLKAYAAGDPDDFGSGGLAGLTELFDLDKPVIAAVNGYAAGGGFELVLSCDLVLAVPEARFSLPEVKLGFIPDSGGIFRLPRRMPHPLAMEMLLTGEPIDAAEAERWGLVNRVVEPAELLGAARRAGRPDRGGRAARGAGGQGDSGGERGADRRGGLRGAARWTDPGIRPGDGLG